MEELKRDSKPWYKSKTIIVNAIALIALIIQEGTGFVISPAIQAEIITLINFILRKVTKNSITFK